MKTKFVKNFLPLFAVAAFFFYGCTSPLDEYSSSSSDLRNISGLKNRASISKMPFMGGAALYNPADLATSQLDEGAVVAVRLGKIQKTDVGDVKDVYSDIRDEAIYGYITIDDISQEQVTFSYFEFESVELSDSEDAVFKSSFTLEAGKSCDLNNDGIDDIRYMRPFTKRKGSEKAMWLAFVNAPEDIKVSSMFSVIPQQYARSAYPGGLIGINSDGRYVVSKYDVGTSNRAIVKSLAYGDYIVDNEANTFATYVGTKSSAKGRALADDEIRVMEINEDDAPEMYYFQNSEFVDNYSIYDLLDAMPSKIVTKEYKSLSISDAVAYLNELAKNSNLWQELVEGDTSDAANEVRENLNGFSYDSELQVVLVNRKVLSVLYPDLCPQISTYSTSFPIIFPWFSLDLGDLKENSAALDRSAARAMNPILSNPSYTDEYKEYVRERDSVVEEFSHFKSFDLLPCIVGAVESPVLKSIVGSSDSCIRIGIGGHLGSTNGNPNYNVKLCLLFKYEFKDAVAINMKTVSLFTTDEFPGVIDTKKGEVKTKDDFQGLSEEGLKFKLDQNKKDLEKQFGIDNFSWLGFQEVGSFRGSQMIRPSKDAKNFHRAFNLCSALPIVCTFDATFDILFFMNALVEFRNVVFGGIYMVGFGVESGINWSFIRKWIFPVGISATPYAHTYKISKGTNFAGIITKDSRDVQLGGGIKFMLAPVLEIRGGLGVGANFGIISADFTVGAPITLVLPVSVYLGITTGNHKILNLVAETQGNFKAYLGLDIQICLDPPIVKKRRWQWPLWNALEFDAQLWKKRWENGKRVVNEGPKVVSYDYPFKN